jgi:hypothetical protein
VAPGTIATGFVNNSGQGVGTPVPAEIQGWSWSAFLMGWIWCIAHNSWLGFGVSLGAWVLQGLIVHGRIPLGLAAAIFCGAKGNEWAWQNRRWESLQQFRDTQRVWVVWGIVLWALGVVGTIIAIIAALAIGAAALHAMGHGMTH